MGKRWRQLNEKVRQRVVAPHFQPASIERNQMMFREASTYLRHFKIVLRKLTRVMQGYEEMTASVHALLECRVPRLYTVESDGSVGAEMQDGDAYLGTGLQIQQLKTSIETLSKRMSEEVISALQQWFKSYERCRGLLNDLKNLKYELDSRRRTVLSLDNRQKDFAAKISQGDASRKIQLETTSMKLTHKERKLDLCQSEFQQKEEELNQALRALLAEVQGLAELIGHVYQILSDAPNDARRAFKEGAVSSVDPATVVAKPQASENRHSEHSKKVDRSNPFLTPSDSSRDSPRIIQPQRH